MLYSCWGHSRWVLKLESSINQWQQELERTKSCPTFSAFRLVSSVEVQRWSCCFQQREAEMLKTLAAHFEFHLTLDSNSVTVEESQASVASVASAEDVQSTKYTARWYLWSEDYKYSKYEAFIYMMLHPGESSCGQEKNLLIFHLIHSRHLLLKWKFPISFCDFETFCSWWCMVGYSLNSFHCSIITYTYFSILKCCTTKLKRNIRFILSVRDIKMLPSVICS